MIFICFNLFCTPEDIDSIFGQISYIAYFFLSRMIEFNLCWYTKEGVLSVFEVIEAPDYLRIISILFSEPIPVEGKAIDEYAYKKADWFYIVKPNLESEVVEQ